MVSLTDADIICSGGRGLGDASGFELIKQFADKVGGVVGSSRAAVDAGWIDHSHQVGQTGTTVKPEDLLRLWYLRRYPAPGRYAELRLHRSDQQGC